MTGQGGWPMTVVLDHEGAPFFAGTYFPDQPRQGQPAFRQVLEALSDAWTNRRDEVTTVAADVAGHLRQEVGLAGEEPLDADLLAGAVRSLADDFDATNGGFGTSPKFPPSMVLELLLRHAARTGSPNASGMADQTLRAMARGGIYDQLAGGFARYSVDRELGRAALREDALRQRAAARCLRPLVAADGRPARRARRAADRRLPARRAADRPGWLRLRARRRHRGCRGQVLRLDAGRAVRGARRRRRRLGGDTARGHRDRHLRARPVHAPAAHRPRRPGPLGVGPDPPARRACHAHPPGPRRQGGRGLERSRCGVPRRGRGHCSGSRGTSTLRSTRCGWSSTGTSTAAGCAGSPATGSSAGTPVSWRTTPASRRALSRCSRRPVT